MKGNLAFILIATTVALGRGAAAETAASWPQWYETALRASKSRHFGRPDAPAQDAGVSTIGYYRYTFKKDCPGCWPDWYEAEAPQAGSEISVGNGAGLITAWGLSKEHYYGNVEHLVAPKATSGYNAATATIAFTGDDGHTGWIHLHSDDANDPMRDCLMLQGEDPPILADAVYMPTLYDDGSTFVGLAVGLPLPFQFLPPAQLPRADYALAYFVQVDVNGWHVLGDAVELPAIPVNEKGKVTVTVRQDNGIWRASGRVEFPSATADVPATALASVPNLSGNAGIAVVTNPSMMCENNGVKRQFTTYAFSARLNRTP